MKLSKPEWGPGPWQGEPDIQSFVSSGLWCVCGRGPVGSWNGYVGLPVSHALYGLDSRTPTPVLRDWLEIRKTQPLAREDVAPSLGTMVAALFRGTFEPTIDTCSDVHGGVTWCGTPAWLYSEIPPPWWMCRLADQFHWIGFDTAHAGDLSPQIEMLMDQMYVKRGEMRIIRSEDVYRTATYVRNETERLAAWLADVDAAARLVPARSLTIEEE